MAKININYLGEATYKDNGATVQPNVGNVVQAPDVPKGTPKDIKKIFDANAENIKNFINKILIPALNGIEKDVDNDYDPESDHPQSGKAVAQAIAKLVATLNEAISNKADKDSIPTKVSQLDDDNYYEMRIGGLGDKVFSLETESESRYNKVGALDESENAFENYPSVQAVVNALNELSAAIELSLEKKLSSDVYYDEKEEMEGRLETVKKCIPVYLSELKDDTDENPVKMAEQAASAINADNSYMSANSWYSEEANISQFAVNAETADKAITDDAGRCISETYAEKTEVSEVDAKKLDREWNLLGWEEVTQADIDSEIAKGKTGITTLTVPCGDMSSYVELMCRVEIPKNTLNDKNYHFRVGLSAGGEILPHPGNGWLMTGQGYTDFMMDKSLLIRFAVKSTFINGRHAYNEIVKDYYGLYKMPMGGNVATMFGDSYYHAAEIAGNNTYWFIGNTEDDTSSYIFPAGTRIEIYGR